MFLTNAVGFKHAKLCNYQRPLVKTFPTRKVINLYFDELKKKKLFILYILKSYYRNKKTAISLCCTVVLVRIEYALYCNALIIKFKFNSILGPRLFLKVLGFFFLLLTSKIFN